MNHPQDPEPILQNLVRDVAMVLRHGLSEAVARGQYPLPSRTIDLDDENYLRKMPAHDRWRHLERLIKAANPRLSDIGLAQTDNDIAAHVLISEKLRERVPGSIVVGEEADESDWAKCKVAPAGTLVWQLDAIDGSALQDTVGFGYSANVILYRKQEAAPAEPLISVTVTSSSTMMAWVYTGQVGASHLNSIDPHTGEPMILELLEPVKSVEQVREGWIAVVAAQAKDRAKVQALFDTDLSIMTLGGAPALPGLLLEKLAAIVIPSPQTRHDAPLLPLASHMGMHFIDLHTGENYSDADVRAFFTGIAHPNDVDYKPVPAMVISRDLLFGIELANIIRNGRTDKAS